MFLKQAVHLFLESILRPFVVHIFVYNIWNNAFFTQIIHCKCGFFLSDLKKWTGNFSFDKLTVRECAPFGVERSPQDIKKAVHMLSHDS